MILNKDIIELDEINCNLEKKDCLLFDEHTSEFIALSKNYWPTLNLKNKYPVEVKIIQIESTFLLAWLNKNKVFRIWAYASVTRNIIFPINIQSIPFKRYANNSINHEKILFLDPKYYDASNKPREYRGLRLIYENLHRLEIIECYYNAFMICNHKAFSQKKEFEKEEIIFFEEIVQEILTQEITYVAVSWQRNYTERLIRLLQYLRSNCPNIIVMCGGPMVTELIVTYPWWHPFHPVNIIRDNKNIPIVDIYFVGESEETIIDYFNYKEFTPGIHSYDFKNSKLIINPPRKNPDINCLPLLGQVNNEYLSKKAKLRLFPFINSSGITEGARGCPHNCSYCPGPALKKLSNPYETKGHLWCQRKPDIFVEELLLMSKQGKTNIFISDNTFTANKKWVYEVSKLIRKLEIHQEYTIYSRFDDFYINQKLDVDLVKCLSKMNVKVVSLGFESAAPEVLTSINKKLLINIDRYVEVLNLLHDYGIKTRLTAIIGLKNETYEQAIKTRDVLINYAKKNYVDYFDVHNETELEHNKQTYGKKDVYSFIWTEGVDYPLEIFKTELLEKGKKYFYDHAMVGTDKKKRIYLHHHFFNDCKQLNVPNNVFPKSVYYGKSFLTIIQMGKIVYDIMSELSKESSFFASRSGN